MARENDGVHFCLNGVLEQKGSWQIFLRKFWQRTEAGKFPVSVHFCRCMDKAK